MSKIYGKEDVINRAKSAKPGDMTMMINWDAIEELPDEFEPHVNAVKFDPKNLDKFFTNVGSDKYPKWYPHIEFMYKIAEARGVKGSEVIAEPLYEDVEIDEMNMTTTGMLMKKKVGWVVKKSAEVLEEDGTMRTSGERISVENAWENCIKLWHKEEAATQGYSTEIVKDGEYTYYKKQYTGKHYIVQNGQYKNAVPIKYDTKWKRKICFDEALDKALGMADSKAKSKAIREVVGLPTGFSSPDLASGEIIVCKIRRSRMIMKAETAAKLAYMSRGGGHSNEPIELLFNNDPKGIPEPTINAPVEPLDSQPFEEYEPPKTQKELFIAAIDQYNQAGQIPEVMMETAEGMIRWVESQDKPEENVKYWGKALENLTQIENEIPEDYRIKHGLY